MTADELPKLKQYLIRLLIINFLLTSFFTLYFNSIFVMCVGVGFCASIFVALVGLNLPTKVSR